MEKTLAQLYHEYDTGLLHRGRLELESLKRENIQFVIRQDMELMKEKMKTPETGYTHSIAQSRFGNNIHATTQEWVCQEAHSICKNSDHMELVTCRIKPSKLAHPDGYYELELKTK